VVRLLPIVFEPAATPEGPGGEAEAVPDRWFYEPGFEPIMRELLETLLRMQVEDVLLESYAAEQGARMITMEEATERADRTLQELTVAFNRLRREVITTDLIGVLFASQLREGSEDVPAHGA
jgi:F-type H+-transporting ATPase subunit gamma